MAQTISEVSVCLTSALASAGRVTLCDLKRCRMAHIFFDTFFNLEKYLDHEQRDPFAVQKVMLPHTTPYDAMFKHTRHDATECTANVGTQIIILLT